uniref:hypothetical protein n=1 Tax=Clostridium sp. NkU-1 TaxID=1095009 RepID=UPI000A65AA59
MTAVKDMIDKSKTWTRYLQKKINANLDDFTANAGSNNYTCIARNYKIHTGYSFQAQSGVPCLYI